MFVFIYLQIMCMYYYTHFHYKTHSKMEILKHEMKSKVKVLIVSSSYITVDGHAYPEGTPSPPTALEEVEGSRWSPVTKRASQEFIWGNRPLAS